MPNSRPAPPGAPRRPAAVPDRRDRPAPPPAARRPAAHPVRGPRLAPPPAAPQPAAARSSRLRPRAQRGQAAVELVALLPVIAVLTLGAWQVVLTAHAAWSARAAARAVARAHAVGADEPAAARRALPASLDPRFRLEEPDADGRAVVRVRVPAIVPGLRLGSVSARAGFVPQS